MPELLSLKVHVEETTPVAAYTNSGLPKLGYNALLCNLYRNGNDSVGLHADAEPEMGPVIASVSLGAGRVFRLKRKDGSVAFSERLPHGSLLIMAGNTQKHFKHEVPKEPGVTQPRINLTFRRIEHNLIVPGSCTSIRPRPINPPASAREANPEPAVRRRAPRRWTDRSR